MAITTERLPNMSRRCTHHANPRTKNLSYQKIYSMVQIAELISALRTCLTSTPRTNFRNILISVTQIAITIYIYLWIRKKTSLLIFHISLSISGTLYLSTTSTKTTRVNFGLSMIQKNVWTCIMQRSSLKFFQKLIGAATKWLIKKNKSWKCF